MFGNFISSLPVKRGGSLSFLVGTISNVLIMEIGFTDVGSGGYILVSCAHSNTSFISEDSEKAETFNQYFAKQMSISINIDDPHARTQRFALTLLWLYYN